MTILEVKLKLNDNTIERLQSEAERRNLALDEVLSEVVDDYFDEPTEEELLESLKISMQQALAGDVRPAREALAEIERELKDNANQS